MKHFWKKTAAVLLTAGFCFSAKAELFNAKEFFLDNGLQVIVVPNHKAPIIRHMVWYKVGSTDEKIGQGGTAHLLEHLMFRGTKKIKGTELNRIMENNGMDNNAFTGADFTAYYESMDISRLELAMFLEADRMRNLDISQEAFELERDIVYQERKQVVENNPAADFGEMSRKIIWQDHPYGRPVTGMPDEIKNLKIEDVRDFYSKYYAPNNAVLVLSGDIDFAVAKKLAEKYYGGLKPSKIAEKAVFPELKNDLHAKLDVNLPKINSVRVSESWLAPSYNTDKSDIYNLTVLSKYLGEGKTSKLYKKLVENKKTALAIESSYDYMVRSYSTFDISAIPTEGTRVEILREDIRKAVAEALDEIDEAAIENAKQKLLAGLVYLKDNPNHAAYLVGAMLSTGMKPEEIEAYADKIRGVNYKEVKKAGKKLLLQPPRLSSALLPQTENDND